MNRPLNRSAQLVLPLVIAISSVLMAAPASAAPQESSGQVSQIDQTSQVMAASMESLLATVVGLVAPPVQPSGVRAQRVHGNW